MYPASCPDIKEIGATRVVYPEEDIGIRVATAYFLGGAGIY